MAQSLTVTASDLYLRGDIGEFKLTLDWVSASDGTVALAIVAALKSAKPSVPNRIHGKLKMIETIPGLLGDKTTATPTDNYDITITDSYGYDVATGNLADRSASIAQAIFPVAEVPVDDELTLNITNAGDTKKGRTILYFD